MLRKLLIAIACSAGIASSASGTGDFSVKRAGLFTCGQMLDQLAQDPKLLNAVYASWLLGFFSGANSTAARLSNKDVRAGEGVEPEEMRRMLLDSCAQNPYKSVFQAGVEVYERIAKRPP